MRCVCGLVGAALVIATAWAEEAAFDASAVSLSAALQLVEGPDGAAISETIDGMTVVSPPPNKTDYLERHGLYFSVPDGFGANASELFLVVEHMDSALGLIQVRYVSGEAPKADRRGRKPRVPSVWSQAEGLGGYTCVGTGKPRRAVFRLASPRFDASPGEDIRIAGASGVRRVFLKTALESGEVEAAKAEVPVQPAARVVLQRPMELVMSVGADADDPEGLAKAMEGMSELCPVAAALGFNGVESYVKWNFIEREKGQYDWSFYDGIMAEAQRHGLKWFPLLIVGSAYTLPKWYHDSPENEGFVCLEHGQSNNIQTIFCENQTPYVQSFLKAFGEHYEPTGNLLGVRLGPSGNFGESQYPAGGNWGYEGKPEHIHIGWWAGDRHAHGHFQAWLQKRYESIEALNKAWHASYGKWNEVNCSVPQFMQSARQRKDFTDWYMGAMSDWCERWALWAREGMPKTPIYQSAGGWGFVESGTDFTDQTKSMVKVDGGIRTTNETDSYSQNFQVTRMMSSAARFYGVDLGSEPAGFNSAKGVASRIYNMIVNNGQHLFFYSPGLLNYDQSIQTWLELAPLMDQRAEPVLDVAVLYPDTLSKVDDGVFRNLYASNFYQRVAPLRTHLDFDYCSERMVMDGALPRYKVLVLPWNTTIETESLNAIDAWVRDGGTVMVMYWDRFPIQTVEGDTAVLTRWINGDAGDGRAVLIRDDREPPHRFADRVREELLATEGFDPLTSAMLRVEKPDEVYVSALQSGVLAVLNYNDTESVVTVPGKAPITVAPYRIALVPMR